MRFCTERVNDTLSTSLSEYVCVFEFGLTYSPAAAVFFVCLFDFFRMFAGVSFGFSFCFNSDCTVIVAVCDAVFQFFYFCAEKTVIPKLG